MKFCFNLILVGIFDASYFSKEQTGPIAFVQNWWTNQYTTKQNYLSKKLSGNISNYSKMKFMEINKPISLFFLCLRLPPRQYATGLWPIEVGSYMKCVLFLEHTCYFLTISKHEKRCIVCTFLLQFIQFLVCIAA